MKKFIAIIMAAVMLVALSQSVMAEVVISPTAEIQFVDIIFIDLDENGTEQRIKVPDEQFNSYYVLVKSSDAESGSDLRIISDQFEEAPDIKSVVGNKFSDHRMVKTFAVEHVGQKPDYDFVEFSVYVSEMKDSDQNTIMRYVNGAWEEIQIISIKDSIVTFRTTIDKAEAVYSVIAKKTPTSPPTGVNYTPAVLIAAASLFLGVAAYSVYHSKKED